jgi:hypothetical protein
MLLRLLMKLFFRGSRELERQERRRGRGRGEF